MLNERLLGKCGLQSDRLGYVVKTVPKSQPPIKPKHYFLLRFYVLPDLGGACAMPPHPERQTDKTATVVNAAGHRAREGSELAFTTFCHV